MRPPVKSLFRSRQWVDRERCGFGGPGCGQRPDPGHRFCPEHTALFARMRAELGNDKRRFVQHDGTWKAAA